MKRLPGMFPKSFLLPILCAISFYLLPSAVFAEVPREANTVGVGEATLGEVLGTWPLCEASALRTAPWDPQLVLAADNEQDQQLFGFTVEGGRLVPQKNLEMPEGKRPRDIEALAQVGSSLLVVGSHSRSSSCKERSNRQRLRWLKRGADGVLQSTGSIDSKKVWAAARGSQAACLTYLFVDPPPPFAKAVCTALLAAEGLSADGALCSVLNIEGALGTVEGRVWLGMRAPLAEGQALVLRLTSDLDELRFDRVTFLDLEGRGIRELVLAGEMIYGIAGPMEDSKDPFALFLVELEHISSGGRLQPKILRRDLPTSSEGMIVVDRGLLIAVDGAEGGTDEAECASPSRQYHIELR